MKGLPIAKRSFEPLQLTIVVETQEEYNDLIAVCKSNANGECSCDSDLGEETTRLINCVQQALNI